ncbi:hypothetical protein AURDEDRAFT_162839 [Auricularia subglabra TFB-10046 SS5]|nr:hypothetical protein AURDEDRAFT_162839 [Auricularia subglabra TFB-10046 SS5]
MTQVRGGGDPDNDDKDPDANGGDPDGFPDNDEDDEEDEDEEEQQHRMIHNLKLPMPASLGPVTEFVLGLGVERPKAAL